MTNIMILRTLKTRWCDNISYEGMPQHVREVTGGLTRLRFICDQYLGLEEAPGGGANVHKTSELRPNVNPRHIS